MELHDTFVEVLLRKSRFQNDSKKSTYMLQIMCEGQMLKDP